MNDMPPLCLAAAAAFFLAALALLVYARIVEGKASKEVDESAASFHRWQQWARAAPDPESPKYKDRWNDGGGKRYVRDKKRYEREHPAPVVIERKSTTGRKR